MKDNNLDEKLANVINSGKVDFDFEKWQQKYPEALKALHTDSSIRRKQSFVNFNLWRIIMGSPITKLAAAAAVIIIIAGILIINQGRHELKPTPEPDITTDITITELTPTSSMMLKYVYQQGGLSGLEEYLDKNFQTMRPQYPELSIPDILKELDNHENERM